MKTDRLITKEISKELCIKCGFLMERRKQTKTFFSKKQKYYFKEWDWCKKCRYLKHYECFKMKVK